MLPKIVSNVGKNATQMPAIIVRSLGEVAVDEVDDVAVAVVLVAPALLRRGNLLPCSTQHPSISLFCQGATAKASQQPETQEASGGPCQVHPKAVANRGSAMDFKGSHGSVSPP